VPTFVFFGVHPVESEGFPGHSPGNSKGISQGSTPYFAVSNISVDIYLSPVSGKITTIVLPLLSGLCET
jgi:hypothetical protein